MEGHSEQTVAPLSGKHVVSHETTLCLKEKLLSLTGDSFHVRDIDDNDVFKVQGKYFSIHQRKVLQDSQTGQELGIIKNTMFTMHRKQYILDGNQQEVATVSKKKIFQLHANAVVKIHSTNQEVMIEGSVLSRKFSFNLNGLEIARVRRKGLNARNLVGGKDTYFLTVYPGVDMAFMVLATVCLDEIFRDSDGRE
eukprot:TRINITY_DN14729_c0_g1_i1.p1 TRINITY_DN14729_c0_g1~~TRINITY_DN14729_c0_g1_i1.p1  ORF type:complete len:210 (+),score=51.70 TRINITY_DN14729_c0_g1_i1:46-630(+)